MVNNRLRFFGGLCFSLCAGAAVHAQGGVQAPTESVAPLVAVYGLAKDDQLNVRASASPVAMVIARLPNGALVKNLGCTTVGGNLWCKIVSPENALVKGWTPGRYIMGASAAEGAAPADADEQAAGAQESAAATDAGTSILDAKEIPPLDDPKKAAKADDALPVEAYVDLPSARKEVAAPDAAATMATGAVVTPPAEAAGGEKQDAAAPEAAPQEEPASPASAPVPEARPDAEQVASVEPPQAGKAVQAAASQEDGEIPCARYRGQPMARCVAHVVRTGAGQAVVTVTWPDGGSRAIRFDGGKVEGSDSSAPLQLSREVDLNMIRIGKAERFEITDSFAFGE